jgi:predicted peptidase
MPKILNCFAVASLSLCVLLINAANAADEGFQTKSIQYSGGEYKDEKFEYRLLAPEELAADKQYPLVVFLHGAGERGTDNSLQLQYLPKSMATPDMRKKYPCFFLAPQCRAGKLWVDVPWGDKKSTPMAKKPTDQLKTVMQMLELTMKQNPIDARRVYVTGLSMGGYGAWELAARQPKMFAALAPVCGGGDEQQANKLMLPIWAFHGDKDGAVPVQRSQQMVEAIREAGNKSVKYSELPGVGHNSWNNAYAADSGLLDWIFEQKRP